MGVVFVVEVVLGTIGFAYQHALTEKFSSFVNRTIINYRSDPDLQDLIDFAQSYVSSYKILCDIWFWAVWLTNAGII